MMNVTHRIIPMSESKMIFPHWLTVMKESGLIMVTARKNIPTAIITAHNVTSAYKRVSIPISPVRLISDTEFP